MVKKKSEIRNKKLEVNANKNSQDIDKLEEKIKELENNWKRAVADYRNLKKRSEKEKREFANYANQRLLESLLPIFDALEQATRHTEENNGINFIQNQLAETLRNEGVEIIDINEGDKFDPETMEAIEITKSENIDKKDTIIKILREGFIYKERILRPASVQVYS